ncbi:MAG: hypothetical protein RLY14_451 [Planctomycetota bacterium]|jgi:hypothetical protein
MLAQLPYDQVYTSLRLFCSLHDNRSQLSKRNVRIIAVDGKLYLSYAAKNTALRITVNRGKIEHTGSFDAPLRALKRTLEFWPERLVTTLRDEDKDQMFLVEEAGDRLKIPTVKPSDELSLSLERLGSPEKISLDRGEPVAEITVAEFLEVIAECHAHKTFNPQLTKHVGIAIQKNRLIGFYEYPSARIEFCARTQLLGRTRPRYWRKPADIEFRATYRLGDLSKICRLIKKAKLPTTFKLSIWQTKTGTLELYIPNFLRASIRGESLSETSEYLQRNRAVPFDEYRIAKQADFEELGTVYQATVYPSMTNQRARLRHLWVANARFSDRGMSFDQFSSRFPATGKLYSPHKLADCSDRKIKVTINVLALYAKLLRPTDSTSATQQEIRFYAHRGENPQVEIQFGNRRMLIRGQIARDGDASEVSDVF